MSKFIATEPLLIGYARAHNVGDVVPEANIEANGWGDKVAKAAEKAVEASGDATEAPAPVPAK